MFADEPNKCSANAVGHSNMCITDRFCFGRSLMHISAILHPISKWYSASSSLKLLYLCLGDFGTSSICRVARDTYRGSLKLFLEHKRRIDNGTLRPPRSKDLNPRTTNRNIPTPAHPLKKIKKLNKFNTISVQKNPLTWCLRVLVNAV